MIEHELLNLAQARASATDALRGVVDPQEALEILVARGLVPDDAVDPASPREWEVRACSIRRKVAAPPTVECVALWGSIGASAILTAEASARSIERGAVVRWRAPSLSWWASHWGYHTRGDRSAVVDVFRGTFYRLNGPLAWFAASPDRPPREIEEAARCPVAKTQSGARKVLKVWSAMVAIGRLGIAIAELEPRRVTLTLPGAPHDSS